MKDYIPRHARCYYTEAPDPAKPRNFTNEMKQTLAGYQATAPGYLSLEQQYQPAYEKLNLGNAALSAFGYDDTLGHHPGTLELGAAGNTFNRANNLSDVATFGSGVTAANLAANPYLSQGLGQLSARMLESPILSTLNQQAQAGLDANGAMSPEEIRSVTQGARSTFANNGTFAGTPAIGAEILARESARRQRIAAAQQFATSVQGLNQAQNDFVGRGTQIAGTVLPDAWQAITGTSSGAGGSGSGYPQTIGTGSQLFSPTNPYAGDIYSSNFNAQAANNIQQANAANQNTSNYIALAGALLSDRRLKTDIVAVRKTPAGYEIVDFTWRSIPAVPEHLRGQRYRGVIAQQVQEIDPTAVITSRNDGYLRVRYSMIGLAMEKLPNKRLEKAA